MKYVIFDLDGCISDDSHRRYFSKRKDWDAYHELLFRDELRHKRLISDYAKRGIQIVFITARPEKYRKETVAWLEKNEILRICNKLVPHLYMRPNDDLKRSSPDLKKRLTAFFISRNAGEIVAAYDDRADVVNMYIDTFGFPAQILKASEKPAHKTVPEILREMADTFEERNKQYSDNYLSVAPFIKELFPGGVPAGLVETDRWHLFELLVVKMTRFARSELTHIDSIHDAAVYAAMIESDLRRR